MTPIRRLVRAVIGEVRWSPPPWLRPVGRPFRAAGDYRRRQPRRFWSAVVLVLLVAGGGYGLQRWLASRPKPDYLTIAVSNPEPTALEPDAKPNPLRVSFSGSAAPLDRIGKPVADGFTITPAPPKGTWKWDSSSELVFTPAEEWPVGQDYRLDMGPGFLAPQALVESRRLELRSPALRAVIAGAEFWEDPTDPKDKRAVVASSSRTRWTSRRSRSAWRSA